MARRKAPSPQQIGRAGELFVAAELNRRGALATLFLTNTPRVDVVAISADGAQTVTIQVKTKGPRSPSWQWNLRSAELEQDAEDDCFLILVDLAPTSPAYYICSLRTVARAVVQRRKDQGPRPRTPDSLHTIIPLTMVADGKDAWHLLGVTIERESE